MGYRDIVPSKMKEDSVEQRRGLKPVEGDIVRLGGTEYVTIQTGNRFCRAYQRGGDPRFPELLDLRLLVKTGERL